MSHWKRKRRKAKMTRKAPFQILTQWKLITGFFGTILVNE
jgi:hypothetical protein